MYFRTFKRDSDRLEIGEYGFAWYVNEILVRSGLVENMDETISYLLDDGWEEI